MQNFRGVGRAAKLQLEPGPGLTLVVGRNGSGKSSFAEGLELLLTDTNLRWEDRTKVWKDGWRNLHADGPTLLSARFRVDGEAQPLTVSRRWADDAELGTGEERQVSGPRSSWEALGWEPALGQFRPLLSYNELGTMFSERAAALYEALSAVLGLQEFDALAADLRTARLAREKSAKAEKIERRVVLDALHAADGERASTIAGLLAKRPPDLAAIEDVLTGDDDRSSDEALRPAASLTLPTEVAIAGAFAARRAAADELARIEATDADRADALARLLGEAISFHATHDDGATCPVCGSEGVLDPGWTVRADAQAQELRRQSSALREARGGVDVTRRAIDGLFPAGVPAALRAASPRLDVTEAHEAWDRWADVLRDTDDVVLRDGPAAGTELLATVVAARDAAALELEHAQSAWRPVQAAVLAWVATARKAELDASAVVTLKAGESWMSECTAALRGERLEPVVQAAQANWAQLRHESNVVLGKVELRKEGNRRYAEFDVTVDGTSSSAFGVMSQGELSALAVSIFLPRASLPESPFGFMVIDDPVQSMDPAKVDGLARVLARTAEHRQVVVFTHDERLPEAVRRLGIDARIMQVQRRAQSEVEVVVARAPSDRHVEEALSVAKTEHLGDEVRARVLPGLCRTAIEAACASRVRRQRLGAGMSHADVEQLLDEQTSLTSWLAEAFGLRVAQGKEIEDKVRALAGEDGVTAVRRVRAGVHELIAVDGMSLALSTRKLVKAIEAP